MNESYIVQEILASPSRPLLETDTHQCSQQSTQQPQQEEGRISSAEIARKVMKLTGNVRLISRSARHWHHCGINE